MIIDIICSSCARQDLLEQSIYSTRENIISNTHTFRWVIVEDLVNDVERRKLGRDWIESHSNLFDEIVFSDIFCGIGFYWQKGLKLCKSPIHIRAEDDTQYLHKINIDPIVDFLINSDDVISVLFYRKDSDIKHNLKKVILNNLKLTEYKLMSKSVGILKTQLVNNLVDYVGWGNYLHEAGTLTPGCDQLNYKRYVLGHGSANYIHAGQDKKYRKGNWKKS